MPTFKSASELSETQRASLRSLMLALADTKLFLGFHYGEWTFGTPALEACIAACSMSQDEFGHLRLLHACLTSQFEDQSQDLLERREISTFANVSSLDKPLQSWSDFVAANLLVDGAMTVLLSAMQGSAFEPVANFVDKMVEEEKHHVRNAQGWFRSLATANAQTQAALADSCRRMLAATLEWLGPGDQENANALVNGGILNMPWNRLQQNFLDWAGPLAEEYRLDLGLVRQNGNWAPRHSPDFNAWNPITRRCTATHPEEKLLYHLRGSKNDIFKLGEA